MMTAETLKFLDDLKAKIAQDNDEAIAIIENYYQKNQFPENSYHLDDWDLDKIEFLPTTGPSGPYEKAVYQDSRDFRLCLRDLIACNNKMERDGWFLWKFDRENIIGRKKQ
jgi:hypothetical protein